MVIWDSVVCSWFQLLDAWFWSDWYNSLTGSLHGVLVCIIFPLCAGVPMSDEVSMRRKNALLWLKNLVGPVGQGKSQSQEFIDKLHGLGRMLVQIVSLVCWYPLSNTDRVPCRSFLLLSVLQIVDSRPSWILLSVLGELCSTSRIANVLLILWGGPLSLNTLLHVYWLFLMWRFISFRWSKKFFPLVCCSPCFYPRLFLWDLHFTSITLAVRVFFPNA